MAARLSSAVSPRALLPRRGEPLRDSRRGRAGGLLFLLLPLLFLSCTDPHTFRLRGDFTHLRQVDFFVYSTDGGLDDIDTIHVIDGQFDWQVPLEREATFYVVFPNASEQVVFARPGEVVRMKGDAQQLRLASVTGSTDNDALTAFRLEHAGSNAAQFQDAANRFIRENPDSRVSTYLRRQLTLQVAATSRLRIGGKLPAFRLPPDGLDTVADTLTADSVQPLLLVFWASWKRGSRDGFADIRRALRATENNAKAARLHAISISLDTDPLSYANICRYDSLTWVSRCYRLAWETPLVKQFGIKEIPFFVLTDAGLRIAALGTDWKRDILPALNKLSNRK